MAGTLVFTDTIGRSFDGLFADANKGTDSYVRAELAFENDITGDERPRIDTDLIDVIADVDGVRVAEGLLGGVGPDRRRRRRGDRQP